MWIRKLFIVLSIVLLIIVGGSLWLRHLYKTGDLQELVVDKVLDKVNHNMVSSTAAEVKQETDFIKQLLGFDHPQTYLLLFLNNTELRPGGGFIGSYGVISVHNAVPHVEKVDGTEVLDNLAPQNFSAIPPAALQTYLGVKRWGFRDSNWSPDFVSSTLVGLDLYKKEEGTKAHEITMVVGFTPTVLEELLKITGPITVNGEEYTSANFTEKLEHQVEIGFLEKGINRQDRKDVIEAIQRALLDRIRQDIFKDWSAYLALGQRMLQEKHIMLYSLNPEEQKIIRAKEWSGERVYASNQDYVGWVDANLGALKTDAVMQRQLYYSLIPTSTGYLAKTTMTFVHQGKVADWKTSRYQTYARVYVPLGSTLVRVVGAQKNAVGDAKNPIDQGVEGAYQWFGTYTTVPLGKTAELSFEYLVNPTIAEQINQGNYQLFVQKQLGTIDHGLTLHLDFGRSVQRAAPGEDKTKYGDTSYDYQTNLKLDRVFNITVDPRR